MGRNADACVAYKKMNLLVFLGIAHGNTAFLGKFYGVVQEVFQDLLQTFVIGQYYGLRRQFFGQLQSELQVLSRGLPEPVAVVVIEQFKKVVDHNGGRLDFEQTAFNFGNIDDVVDDFDKVFGAGVDGMDEFVFHGLMQAFLSQ